MRDIGNRQFDFETRNQFVSQNIINILESLAEIKVSGVWNITFKNYYHPQIGKCSLLFFQNRVINKILEIQGALHNPRKL